MLDSDRYQCPEPGSEAASAKAQEKENFTASCGHATCDGKDRDRLKVRFTTCSKVFCKPCAAQSRQETYLVNGMAYAQKENIDEEKGSEG